MTTVWLSIVHWVAPPPRGDEYDSSEPVCAYVMVTFTKKKTEKKSFSEGGKRTPTNSGSFSAYKLIKFVMVLFIGCG